MRIKYLQNDFGMLCRLATILQFLLTSALTIFTIQVCPQLTLSIDVKTNLQIFTLSLEQFSHLRTRDVRPHPCIKLLCQFILNFIYQIIIPIEFWSVAYQFHKDRKTGRLMSRDDTTQIVGCIRDEKLGFKFFLGS